MCGQLARKCHTLSEAAAHSHLPDLILQVIRRWVEPGYEANRNKVSHNCCTPFNRIPQCVKMSHVHVLRYVHAYSCTY